MSTKCYEIMLTNINHRHKDIIYQTMYFKKYSLDIYSPIQINHQSKRNYTIVCPFIISIYMLIVIFHQVCLTRFYLGFYFLQYIRDVRAIRKHIWKYIETDSFLLILISTQSLIKFNDSPLWMTGLHFLFSYA